MIRDSDEFADEAADLLEAEQRDAALNVIRQGLRHYPGDRALRFLEASVLVELGHYPIALGILETLRVEARSEVDPTFGTLTPLHWLPGEVCSAMTIRNQGRFASVGTSFAPWLKAKT